MKLILTFWCFMKYLFFLILFSATQLFAEPYNIVVLLTDQERYEAHWPKGWVEKNLPSVARLKEHGLTYERAYTSACMCSPSRAALMSSQFSPTNQIARSLQGKDSVQFPAKNVLLNIASMIEQHSDYEVLWKGKWHLSFAVDGFENWSERDIPHMAATYDINQWTAPDGGNADIVTYKNNPKFALSTLGGGYANNDGRYTVGKVKGDKGETPGWGESVCGYLDAYSARPKDRQKPFCLFISLVNPHDVWVYPDAYQEAGFKLEDFANLDIELPPNYDDNLETKPSIQAKARDALNKISPLKDKKDDLAYVRFYAYLHKVVDKQINTILDKLDEHNLTENTIIIRTSDHGELGLSHGMREKAYTAYEEMIHVPLIISNPKLFKTPQVTDTFYSHVDLMPTVGDIAQVNLKKLNMQGVSHAPIIFNEKEKVRDSVLFAYDDVSLLPDDAPFSHIRAIRSGPWMYAAYYSAQGGAFEYELYNLDDDPGEMDNLLYGERAKKNHPLAAQLHKQLTEQMKAEGALDDSVKWPSEPFSAKDE